MPTLQPAYLLLQLKAALDTTEGKLS